MQAIWSGVVAASFRLGCSALKSSLLPAVRTADIGTRQLSTICSSFNLKPLLSNVHNPMVSSVRSITRDYWPRPNEVKRIRKHGWKHRLSTPGGRRIIMRRILKGRYILSH